MGSNKNWANYSLSLNSDIPHTWSVTDKSLHWHCVDGVGREFHFFDYNMPPSNFKHGTFQKLDAGIFTMWHPVCWSAWLPQYNLCSMGLVSRTMGCEPVLLLGLCLMGPHMTTVRCFSGSGSQDWGWGGGMFLICTIHTMQNCGSSCYSRAW